MGLGISRRTVSSSSLPSTGAWVNMRRFWTDLGKRGLKRPTKACRARIRIRVWVSPEPRSLALTPRA